MEIGNTFVFEGDTYVIKRIEGQIVRASKIKGIGPEAKISRGQPKIFVRRDVETILGVLDIQPEATILQKEVANSIVEHNKTMLAQWHSLRTNDEEIEEIVNYASDGSEYA